MMYKEMDKYNLIMGELMDIFKKSVFMPVSDDGECKILPIDRNVIIAAFSPEIFPEVRNNSMPYIVKKEEK